MDVLGSHDEIDELQRRHPAWQLLRARTAPLALAFLGGVFVEENVRSVSRSDLLTRLDELLHAVNGRADDGDGLFATTGASPTLTPEQPSTGSTRCRGRPFAGRRYAEGT